MHDIKAIRSCDITAQWPSRPHSRASRAPPCVGRPPAPSALRPRSPSRRCAERSAVVDTSPATQYESVCSHARTRLRSARAHTHTCTLTHSTLSFFASLCHSARACMHGCTRATPPRSGVETGLPPHSPVQPFQLHSCELATPFSAAFFDMGLLTDSRAGAGDGQRSDWGRHARTRSFDTLPADSGHLGPEGTPRAPLHTHTRTHSSVAHTRLIAAHRHVLLPLPRNL